MGTETSKADKQGAPVDPAALKSRYVDLVEEYTPERIAEFLLNNAVDAHDYATALEEVRKLGVDPATVVPRA